MLKKVLFLFCLVVLIYLFRPLLDDLRASLELFRQMRLASLALVLLFQIAGYACLTWLNLLCLAPFPGRISFGRMMATMTALAFIQAALPSAGASGIALRTRLLGDNGYSVEAATFSFALETILLACAIALFSTLAVIYLLQEGQLTFFHLVILLLGLVLLSAVAFCLWRLMQDTTRTRQWTLRLMISWDRLLQRFHRRGPSPAEVERRFDQFYHGLHLLRRAPRWPFLASAVGRMGFDVASLAACFWAFGHPIDLGVTLTGYGITLIVSGLGSLPGGLGLADASMAVIFARLGAPNAIALAATVLYRLLSYWLLRAIGFISWQSMEQLRERKQASLSPH